MDKTIDKLKELLEVSIKYGLSELINEQSANSCLVEAIEHIEHLEAENAKLKQDINKIKADAIKRMAIRICDDEFKADYDEIIEYADKIEKGEI